MSMATVRNIFRIPMLQHGYRMAHIKTASFIEEKSNQLDECEAHGMIIYKDDDIIALNKPAGLAVHGGPRLNHDLSHYLHFWQYDESQPPQLAHRLDKLTSGVLLLTRHAAAAKWMAQAFQQHRIIKKYLAITINVPEDMRGSVKSSLSVRNIATKHTMNRVVMSESTSSQSKQAHTEYTVLSVPHKAPRRCCLMQVQPITGLKHQVRVHLADGLNCPVAGDYKFMGPLLRKDNALKRKIETMNLDKGHFCLHAFSIEIDSYYGKQNQPLKIKAPLPDYYSRAIKKLKLKHPDI